MMLVGLAVLCTGVHAAEAPEALTIKMYDVRGASADAIAAAMHEASPYVDHGRRMDGYTVWRIDTSYHWLTDGRQCRLTRFDAMLTVGMTLPHWVSPKHASASVQQRWARFSTALRTHEDGHAAIGRDAQQKILAGADALGPEPDCQVLVRKIDDLVAGVVKTHRQMDVDYDARTNHGESQGAVFP